MGLPLRHFMQFFFLLEVILDDLQSKLKQLQLVIIYAAYLFLPKAALPRVMVAKSHGCQESWLPRVVVAKSLVCQEL